MDREVVKNKPGWRGKITPIAHSPGFEGENERKDSSDGGTRGRGFSLEQSVSGQTPDGCTEFDE